MIRSACRRAALTSRSRCGVSLGMIATPSGSRPFEDLGLGVGDRFFGAEVLDMRRGDGGDQRDVRPDLPGQRGDLAGIVHAHFEHRELGVARHPREAQRHAGVVVVALDRAMDLARAVAVERGVKRFLGAGLADRSGDADDRRAGCARATPGQRLERRERRPRPARAGRRPACETSAPAAPAAKARVDELVAVVDGAGHGDEQVARPDLAAVEGDAGDLERRAAPCRRSPRRSRREVHSALMPRTPARRARRRTAAPGRRRSGRSRGPCRRPG